MLSSLWILVEKDYALLALVQAIAVLILPAFVLLSLLYLLVPLSLGLRPIKAEWIIKTLFKLLPWTMAEIFLIGVLVSLIKIISMADIGLGLSFYAYILFSISMTITLLYVDKYQLNLLLNNEVKNDYDDIDITIRDLRGRLIESKSSFCENFILVWTLPISAFNMCSTGY